MWLLLGVFLGPFVMIGIIGMIFGGDEVSFDKGSTSTLLDRENAVGYWRDHTEG